MMVQGEFFAAQNVGINSALTEDSNISHRSINEDRGSSLSTSSIKQENQEQLCQENNTSATAKRRNPKRLQAGIKETGEPCVELNVTLRREIDRKGTRVYLHHGSDRYLLGASLGKQLFQVGRVKGENRQNRPRGDCKNCKAWFKDWRAIRIVEKRVVNGQLRSRIKWSDSWTDDEFCSPALQKLYKQENPGAEAE